MDLQYIKITNEKSQKSATESSQLLLQINAKDESIKENILSEVYSEENKQNKILSEKRDFVIKKPIVETERQNELEISAPEFVIEEDNLNISPNTTISSSSDPCVDPLAIDEFHSGVISPNTNNESEFTLSKENIIYIVDVDNIKERTNNSSINPITVSSLEEIQNKINCDDQSSNALLVDQAKSQQDSKKINDENEMPSDGSDSGLGLDANNSPSNSFHTAICNRSSTTQLIPTVGLPLKSNLKRRSEEILEHKDPPPTKRGKKSIQFDNVKVFYFPRIQGFCCVPSQGGCTLGMGAKHIQSKTYKLSEHVNEQNGDDKSTLQLCNGKGSSSDETDSDEDLSEENISDLDPDSSGFLQPVPVKTRRALLKAAGIKKIDSSEKDECRAIRSSRELCGCLCRGFCDPDSCSCSQSGIKCQVDRQNFPCGCSREGCANIFGRIEFNPNRVRTHFIHTIMRLEIENKPGSAFSNEISTNQRFFIQSSNSSDNLYCEAENSRNLINSNLQFFPDSVSLSNNHNNFDLFPLHYDRETVRVGIASTTRTQSNLNNEIPYSVYKPFLSPPPTYSYPDDVIEASERHKVVCLSPTNCDKSSSAEAKFTVNSGTSNSDSFSSAYTNFLEECGALFHVSKNNLSEEVPDSYDCLDDLDELNFHQNSLDANPVHDLLNISRNCLPQYTRSASDDVPNLTSDTKTKLNKQSEINVSLPSSCQSSLMPSTANHCTLAPTGHTSTSIFEGTSTIVSSNYVSSSCRSYETKTIIDASNDTGIPTMNSTKFISANVNTLIEANIDSENQNNISFPAKKNCNNNIIENELEFIEDFEEKIPFFTPMSTVASNLSNSFSSHEILNNKTFPASTDCSTKLLDMKDESQKQYQSFNLTSTSCSNLSLTINNSNNDSLNSTLFNITPTTNVDLIKDIK